MSREDFELLKPMLSRAVKYVFYLAYQLEYDDQDPVLLMSKQNYDRLLFALGGVCGEASRNLNGEEMWKAVKPYLELVNRMNVGNPQYRPYR